MHILALWAGIGVLLSLFTFGLNWRRSDQPIVPLNPRWLLPRTRGLTVAHRVWRAVGLAVLTWLAWYNST